MFFLLASRFNLNLHLNLDFMITISELKQTDENALNGINELLPQLSSTASHLSPERLRGLIESSSTLLLVAKNENQEVFGMLSLVVVEIPTGTKCWIEDVVVDTKARGQGLGKALMKHAHDLAISIGAKCVDLTSRASRKEANKLYQSLDYQKRDTNVYRFQIP